MPAGGPADGVRPCEIRWVPAGVPAGRQRFLQEGPEGGQWFLQEGTRRQK